MKLLAFDLSTTVCGYCVYDLDKKKIVELNYFKFTDKLPLLQKAKELLKFLNTLYSKYDIVKFIIEERLKSFRAGGTNAESMLKTAQLNFLCQFLIKENYTEVFEINVQTARKAAYPLFHKIARATKRDNKELAFEMVKDELGETYFPTKVMKSGARKGQTVFIDEARDIADAYVLTKAYINLF